MSVSFPVLENESKMTHICNVTHICNASIWETEARGHRFEACQGHTDSTSKKQEEEVEKDETGEVSACLQSQIPLTLKLEVW